MNKRKQLQAENNLLDEKLTKENQILMTDIVCYLRVSNMYDYEVERTRQDLLDMMLDAQSKQEDIKNRIGIDYKEFCNEIIANSPRKTALYMSLEKIDLICMCMIILLVIAIVLNKDILTGSIFTQDFLNFPFKIKASDLIINFLIIVIAFGIVEYICKTSLSKKKKPRLIRSLIIGGLVGGCTFLLIIMLGKFSFTVPFFALLVFLLSLIIIRLIIKYSIAKVEKQSLS